MHSLQHLVLPCRMPSDCDSDCFVACSGKLVLDGSQVVPAAFKRVAFDTAAERTKAKAELSALKDLADGPHTVRCYGAFEYLSPQDNKHYLQIAME